MTESTRAELLTYLEYDAADFDEFGPILTKLQTQIQEYVDAGSTYLFDSPELHIIQTYLGSKREALDGTVITANLELLETLCYTALDSWHWLEEIGTPTRDALTIGVGALWKRTHHVDVPASGAGFDRLAGSKGACRGRRYTQAHQERADCGRRQSSRCDCLPPRRHKSYIQSQ